MRGGIPSGGRRVVVFCLALLLAFPAQISAYSVLAHENLIDSTWFTDIRPLLVKRFPNATHDELRQAHAYAYGGSIIQDMGYYPYGSKFFSDLTHYVRSGDFILALLRDSNDLNEYAFAMGALAHYAADNDGHRLGTNHAVPLLYPKLERKYGNVVTYEDDPLAHLKTEFGFDVVEVAQQRFAPDTYHDFIGFEVAQPLLDRAFQETYGLDLKSVLKDEQLAINSYRHAVSKTIPKATMVAWQLKKKEIQQDEPGMTRKRFLYNLSRASYEKRWGTRYRQPSTGEKFLAFLFRIIPKIGPLKALALRTPTPETERLVEASFNASVGEYRRLLRQIGQGNLVLKNDNFDVGTVTPPGKYSKADLTYAALLDRLAQNRFATTSPQLQADILHYFSDPAAPNAVQKKPKEWARVQQELAALRQTSPGLTDADQVPASRP